MTLTYTGTPRKATSQGSTSSSEKLSSQVGMDHPRKLHWMPSGFYDSGLFHDDIMEKLNKDCEAGVHDEYNRKIWKTYRSDMRTKLTAHRN